MFDIRSVLMATAALIAAPALAADAGVINGSTERTIKLPEAQNVQEQLFEVSSGASALSCQITAAAQHHYSSKPSGELGSSNLTYSINGGDQPATYFSTYFYGAASGYASPYTLVGSFVMPPNATSTVKISIARGASAEGEAFVKVNYACYPN